MAETKAALSAKTYFFFLAAFFAFFATVFFAFFAFLAISPPSILSRCKPGIGVHRKKCNTVLKD